MINVRCEIRNINKDAFRDGKVRVGWFSDLFYEDGVSVAQVAYWNEYGTYNIPARPFMRPMLHQNQNAILENLRFKYEQAIKDNRNTMKVLNLVGEDVVARIQSQILATVNPPNAEITLKGGWMKNKKTGRKFYVIPKVGSHPLIDTGVMYQTVNYQTEEVFG